MNDSSSRIAGDLRRWLASAPAGARLPPTRSLVTEYAVSPLTVQNALRALVAEGLIETRPGAGAFALAPRAPQSQDFGWQTLALGPRRGAGVAEPTALRPALADMIALHEGYPDPELLPHRLVRGALTRAGRSAAALARSPAAGLPELRAWFAADLAGLVPAGMSPPAASDVAVLPGSQSGLAAIFRALVGPDGVPLLVESPTYWGAIHAAAQVGVPMVPVPSGPDGPDPDQLEQAFASTGARVFYAQPNFANPTGAQWSNARAARVREIVARFGAFVVEDDWAHDFGITTEAVPLAARDVDGHVVYLRSLTKSVSPALRVAAAIIRGPARERVLADLRAGPLYVSPLLQAAALDVVTQPGWRTHLRGLRRQLGARRDLMIAQLREHVPSAQLTAVPGGGLNLWVRLADGVDLAALVGACEKAGLLVAAGDEWFPAEPTGPHLRLNYAGPDPGRFGEAMQILGAQLAEHEAGGG
ncbi:aminotransferase-like domain-containing protein [Naumannella huperziae]